MSHHRDQSVILSIVIVTFRDRQGLVRTLESLRPAELFAGSQLEVLVVDGGTEGGLEEIAEQFSWANLVSEPDRGVYDAMNKGLRRSTGRFVWFLNGGDESLVSDWRGMWRELQSDGGRELALRMYAYDLRAESRSQHRSPRSPKLMWHGLPTSHQAILYPGHIARRFSYDLSYAVTGDYQFTAALVQAGVRVLTSERVIARFHAGGLSQQAGRLLQQEAARVQREILHSPAPLRAVSAVLHTAARWRRSRFTRERAAA